MARQSALGRLFRFIFAGIGVIAASLGIGAAGWKLAIWSHSVRSEISDLRLSALADKQRLSIETLNATIETLRKTIAENASQSSQRESEHARENSQLKAELGRQSAELKGELARQRAAADEQITNLKRALDEKPPTEKDWEATNQALLETYGEIVYALAAMKSPYGFVSDNKPYARLDEFRKRFVPFLTGSGLATACSVNGEAGFVLTRYPQRAVKESTGEIIPLVPSAPRSGKAAPK
jgi:hypothetical protein